MPRATIPFHAGVPPAFQEVAVKVVDAFSAETGVRNVRIDIRRRDMAPEADVTLVGVLGMDIKPGGRRGVVLDPAALRAAPRPVELPQGVPRAARPGPGVDGGGRVVSGGGRARARAVKLLLATVLAWLAPVSAAAHPAQVAHARIAIEERAVEIALSMNLFELDLVLSLDRDLDGAVSAGGARGAARRHRRVPAWQDRRVGIRAARCPWSCAALGIGRSGDGRAVVEATLAFLVRAARCATSTIRCEPLTELGADHTTLARIDTRDGSRQFLFRPGVTYRQAPGPLAQALEFLKLGIVHIFIGYDHIAFLLGLLLAGGSTLTIVKIVTAFTAAHSVTLVPGRARRS